MPHSTMVIGKLYIYIIGAFKEPGSTWKKKENTAFVKSVENVIDDDE